MLEAGVGGGLAQSFPERTELVFEGNTAYLSVFSCVKNMSFVQNCSFKSMNEAMYLL
jgi:hypothetical protein